MNVRSVDRAVAVLQFVAHTAEPPRLGEISGGIGTPKSTMLNILRTLTSRHMLVFDATRKRYALGPAIRELASHASEKLDLRTVARPHLTRLAHLTQEAVLLSIPDGYELVYVDKIDSTQPIRYNAQVGSRRPLHCTSAGKLNLALAPPSFVDRYEREVGFSRYTERTITDPTKLREELARIRRRGYSVTTDEYSPGLMALAAPVLGWIGVVVAAVTIAGPTFRLKSQQQQLGAAVSAVAAAITAEYSGRGERDHRPRKM